MKNQLTLAAWTVCTAILVAAPTLAREIVHDAEYYVLEAQNGEAWAAEVRQMLPPGDYVYLCGQRYREGLPPGEVPMHGLKFGHQLQWLKRKGY